MSRGLITLTRARPCFPRVSGDEPAAYQDLGYRCEFSPRERG